MNTARVSALSAILVAATSASWLGCSSNDSSSSPTPVTDGGSLHDAATTGGKDAGAGTTDGAAAVGSTDCPTYCATVMASCTADAGLAQYDSTSECLAMCAALPAGQAGATSGDSIGCRTYHASVAGQSTTSAKTHCTHAGPYGGEMCGTKCESFCALATALCVAPNPVAYPDAGSCAQACAGFAVVDGGGDYDTTSGNSLNCRLYHTRAAYSGLDAGTPATHCPHIEAKPTTGCVP